MQALKSAIVLCTAVALAACSGLFPWGESVGFIKVKGIHFVQNDRPYYFAGSNFWYGGYLGSPGRTGDRPRLLRELDSLSAIGLTNLRILAGSEHSYLKQTLRPAITRAPGVIDDSLLEGLDFLLSEMAKHHMRAVLYLTNYWEWSGGMAVYNAWADSGGGVDPDFQGWPAFMNYSGSFCANENANRLFRAYIRLLVQRRNTCNGRLYSEDPTIMSWQLANEPRPGFVGPEGDRNLGAYYRWINETAGFIHSLDSNHLVSTGSEGAVGYGWSGEFALKTHEFRSIDYVTFHLWPKNWEWFDPLRYDQTLPPTEDKALSYVTLHCSIARALDKPLVLEEFGLARDSAKCAPGTPTTARDRYFQRLVGLLEDSARTGGPIAGANVWGWGGLVRGPNPDNVWRPGDPFLIDPPHEPQGYNSIFAADTSTIRILRNHALRMIRLCGVDSLLAVGAPAAAPRAKP